MNNDIRKYDRGQVWWYDFGEQPRGIMGYRHMAVIISVVPNPAGACTVVVLPITSAETAQRNKMTEELHMVPIEAMKPSYVCCNQMRSVITKDLKEYVGNVSPEKMLEIDKAICQYLVLKQYEKQEAIVMQEIETSTYSYIVDALTRDAAKTGKTGKDSKIVKDIAERLASVMTGGLEAAVTKQQAAVAQPKNNSKFVIVCEETGERWYTIKDAADAFGVTPGNISRSFKQTGKHHLRRANKTLVCRDRFEFEH